MVGSAQPTTLTRCGMATGKPKFYWDTAPLIAWITDEKRDDPAEMAGLAEVLELVDRGKAILMTSVLWRAEVFDSSLTPAQKKKLEAAFDGSSLLELGIDSRVMTLTSEIRAFQAQSRKKDALKTLSVPDAIHLASAIHWGASNAGRKRWRTSAENLHTEGQSIPVGVGISGRRQPARVDGRTKARSALSPAGDLPPAKRAARVGPAGSSRWSSALPRTDRRCPPPAGPTRASRTRS